MKKQLLYLIDRLIFTLRSFTFLFLWGVSFFPYKRRKHSQYVAFQAHAIHLMYHLKPVVEELKKKNTKVCFICMYHPEYPLSQLKKLANYARDELKIKEDNILNFWEIAREKFSVIIVSYPFLKIPHKQTEMWMMNHGPFAIYDLLKWKYKRNNLEDFSKILTAGEVDKTFHRKIFAKEQRELPTIEIVGLPSLDNLKNHHSKKQTYFKNLGLDINKKTILFAPSWGFTHVYGNTLSFYFENMYKLLSITQNNIIIKLHACSYNYTTAKGVNWLQRLQEINKEKSNIAIDYDIADTNALKWSDILITDISSRSFNFMLLDKPIILFSKMINISPEDKSRFALMAKGSYLAENFEDILPLLKRILNNPSEMSLKRQAIARQCFSFWGESAQRIVKMIEEI